MIELVDSALSTCPFRGLTPYTEDDAPYFFGRDSDCDLVIANLMASRLTVLYGPSGVGKSSLLRAGVLRQLRQIPDGDFGYLAVSNAVVVYHSAWTGNPLISLGAAVRAAVPAELGGPESLPSDGPLSVELLRHVTDGLGADVYLLCDQFEEVTLYQTGADAEAFVAEFGRIVAAPGLRVNLLIGIREDAFTKLDRFTPHVADIMGNHLKLDHLLPAAAREAIEKPIARYNETIDVDQRVEIEDGLIDELLAQLRTGRVAVDAGPTGTADESTIETPYLQLVMTRLWAAEVAAGSRVLRRATLLGLGGAEGIVRGHLDEVMAELTEAQVELAAKVLRYLVTPSGAKIANSAESLAYFAGLPNSAELTEVLEALSGGHQRILRPVPASEAWVTLAGRAVLLVSPYYSPGSRQYSAATYDPATGRVITRFGDDAGGYAASVSPGSTRVVTVGLDTAVSVWDAATGQLVSRSPQLGTRAGIPRFVTATGDRIALVRQHPDGLGLWNIVFWDWQRGWPRTRSSTTTGTPRTRATSPSVAMVGTSRSRSTRTRSSSIRSPENDCGTLRTTRTGSPRWRSAPTRTCW